ncbi:MAG: AAA family ATPase [Phycisphaeraceae bacterium]
MTLTQRLAEYVRACFTGLWIESHEHDDALRKIAQLCAREHWKLATWNIATGLNLPGGASAEISASDPLAAIRALNTLGSEDGAAVLVLVNFHRFLGSAEIVQALAQQISAGKQNRTFIIILSPVVQIPIELEKLFAVIEHELPDREQLQEIAAGIATDEGELPVERDLDRVLDASSGLTRYEAENAFSLSLVRHGRIQPDAVWELKTQMLKKSGMLSLHRGDEKFADLGGLDALKAFCLRAMRSRSDQKLRPKGVLLLSPPGCGKSQFCKALGNETGRPMLHLDVGSLMGSLVGQSEERTRQALRIADAMSPCILFIDEIDKALAGVASSGQTDSGVSARLFGTLLTWMNDHTSDVMVTATCNDISKLPPEMTRAERFDGVFFVDLPTAEQRQAIWRIYIEAFGIDRSQKLPADENWTGAEIKACCRLAALLDLPLVAAAHNVVPVAVTAAESVEKLRTWASGRCLSADQVGIYRRDQTASAGSKRRQVRANPRDN